MFGLRNKPTEYKRGLWLVLAITILVAGFFLVTERVHECKGEDCPICATLEETQKNVLGALPDLIPAAGTVFLAVVLALCAAVRLLFTTADTPVARKVRLDR
ncbi:MAG: hypothetical protein J5757_02735 [Lachnospiraceae bacterium]|nr:hypothetical protein [Lachnospiraceae bacterium]